MALRKSSHCGLVGCLCRWWHRDVGPVALSCLVLSSRVWCSSSLDVRALLVGMPSRPPSSWGVVLTQPSCYCCCCCCCCSCYCCSCCSCCCRRCFCCCCRRLGACVLKRPLTSYHPCMPPDCCRSLCVWSRLWRRYMYAGCTQIPQYIVARSKTAEEAYSDVWEVIMEMADRAASRGCSVPTEGEHKNIYIYFHVPPHRSFVIVVFPRRDRSGSAVVIAHVQYWVVVACTACC